MIYTGKISFSLGQGYGRSKGNRGPLCLITTLFCASSSGPTFGISPADVTLGYRGRRLSPAATMFLESQSLQV